MQLDGSAPQTDVLDGLLVAYATHLTIARQVLALCESIPEPETTYSLDSFVHLVKWSFKESFSANWEINALVRAEEIGLKYDHKSSEKQRLERMFNCSWSFDCPVCDDYQSAIGELDSDALNGKCVIVKSLQDFRKRAEDLLEGWQRGIDVHTRQRFVVEKPKQEARTISTHTKAPNTRIKVGFPDGTLIEEYYAADTFALALRKFGFKRVESGHDALMAKLPWDINGREFITDAPSVASARCVW